MKDVCVQSSPRNLTSLWLPIGGSEAQVHRACPSRAPRAARSPHWQHTIRPRWEGVAPRICCARRPDTNSNPKSSAESAKLKKFAPQLLLAVSNNPIPFFIPPNSTYFYSNYTFHQVRSNCLFLSLLLPLNLTLLYSPWNSSQCSHPSVRFVPSFPIRVSPSSLP